MRALVLAVRDALVLAITLALWLWVLPMESGAIYIGSSIAAALLTVLSGFFLHEWGHLLGAVALGSRVHLPSNPLASPFLFRFDTVHNTARQFCAMSLGGFVASLLVVLALLLCLPRGHLATTLALTLTGLGVLATIVIEFPEFWRVWRGAPLPTGAAYVSDGGPSSNPT